MGVRACSIGPANRSANDVSETSEKLLSLISEKPVRRVSENTGVGKKSSSMEERSEIKTSANGRQACRSKSLRQNREICPSDSKFAEAGFGSRQADSGHKRTEEHYY
jgi:hypothetical protein